MCGDEDSESDCCCCSQQVADRCYVISVVTLISFCYFSYYYLIVIPLQFYASVNGWINLILLNCSFTLLVVSYIKTMKTNPGYVIKNWVPPGLTQEQLEALRAHQQQQQVKRNTQQLDIPVFYEPRWCNACKSFKPPRSHHCSDLKVCVLRMDHYCPWVYNAVGYRNHKFFIQFLFYASISLIYFLICCVVRVVLIIQSAPRHKFPFTIPEAVLLLIQLVLTLPVTIGIVSLFCYQFSCLWGNLTSIETYSFRKFKRGARASNVKNFRWFYDYGVFSNIKEVLGYRLIDWFIPRIPDHIAKGDGISFKTRTLHEFGLTTPQQSPPQSPPQSPSQSPPQSPQLSQQPSPQSSPQQVQKLQQQQQQQLEEENEEQQEVQHEKANKRNVPAGATSKTTNNNKNKKSSNTPPKNSPKLDKKKTD